MFGPVEVTLKSMICLELFPPMLMTHTHRLEVLLFGGTEMLPVGDWSMDPQSEGGGNDEI